MDIWLLSHIPRKPELPGFLSHRKFLSECYSKANHTPGLLHRHFCYSLLGQNYRESIRTGSTAYMLRGRAWMKNWSLLPPAWVISNILFNAWVRLIWRVNLVLHLMESILVTIDVYLGKHLGCIYVAVTRAGWVKHTGIDLKEVPCLWARAPAPTEPSTNQDNWVYETPYRSQSELINAKTK